MDIPFITLLLFGFYTATFIGVLAAPLILCLSLIFYLLYIVCKKYCTDGNVYDYLMKNYEYQRNEVRRLDSKEALTSTSNHSTPVQLATHSRLPRTHKYISNSNEEHDQDGIAFSID